MADRKQRPDEDTVYIDENDRLLIVKQMREKRITKAALADACLVTRSAITLLLKPIAKGETRGCRFMSRLQAALGVSIAGKKPSVMVPAESQRRVDRILKALRDDAEALEHWLRDGEWEATKRTKDR